MIDKDKLIAAQKNKMEEMEKELQYVGKVNLEFKAEIALLQKALNENTKVTIIKPKQKQTYKKWMKQGEKKYFEKYFENLHIETVGVLKTALIDF